MKYTREQISPCHILVNTNFNLQEAPCTICSDSVLMWFSRRSYTNTGSITKCRDCASKLKARHVRKRNRELIRKARVTFFPSYLLHLDLLICDTSSPEFSITNKGKYYSSFISFCYFKQISYSTLCTYQNDCRLHAYIAWQAAMLNVLSFL